MCINKLLQWLGLSPVPPAPDPEPIPDPTPNPDPDPIPDPLPDNPRKTALLFGDNYPGTSYQLAGCINDIDDVEKKLNTEFLGYAIKKIENKDVTCTRFYNEIKSALENGKAGDRLIIWYSGHGTQIPSASEPDGYNEAFFFSDGAFTDDRLLELEQLTPEGMIVFAHFDSCFSGGMDRAYGNPRVIKNRFHQLQGVEYRTRVIRRITKELSKWVVVAFCQESQTCADAYFNNRANGAGTFYYLKSFTDGTKVDTAVDNIHRYLPSGEFDQDPVLLGAENLFTEIYL